MYLDYTKLWQLLLERGMTKTDLRNLTGMSSRVLAKLSKNQTVTTATLAKICSVLHCDVADIMECAEEKALTLYRCFKQYGVVKEQTALTKTFTFPHNGQDYLLILSKQSAGKGTHIHCKADGSVIWEQLRMGGMAQPQREQFVLTHPHSTGKETTLVVIKGKPDLITGLDDNGFVSVKGTPKKSTDIYLMTESELKTF